MPLTAFDECPSPCRESFRTGGREPENARGGGCPRRGDPFADVQDRNQETDFAAGAPFARIVYLIGRELATRVERPVGNGGDFLGETFGDGR